MRPGSLFRFHARFELARAGDLARLLSRSEGRGHLLGAAGIAGEAGRGLVLVSDARALMSEAAGMHASMAAPYLMTVWSPLLELVLGCPSTRMSWVFQDGTGRLSIATLQRGGAIEWEPGPDLQGSNGEDQLMRIDPQLAPVLAQILAVGADGPPVSGPWPPLVQSPSLNVRSGGADWSS
ncbi:MAG: hypothetical protein HYX47_12710 [Burkholderiales bacterium]|nr:hypothetical protein [Burkholderiales bacterium]